MSTIENGLRADVMRQRMEDKNSLDKDCIYIGTGNSTSLDGVTIKETIGMNLIEAIEKCGGIKSFPLSGALEPQPLDADLAKSTVNTISFYTENSNVNLGNDCSVPSNSEGIIVSNGKGNITLYYSDAVEAGAFFYNGSTWNRLTQKIKTSSIEPSSSSINLGSNSNSFNTIYTNRYYLPGTTFDFQYNSDDPTQISALIGYSCIKPNGNTLPISMFEFMDGKNGLPNTEDHHTWIKAKGIIPYNVKEINFDIQTDTDALVFGKRGSTYPIKRYDFKNGQGDNYVPTYRGATSLNSEPDSQYCYEFVVPDGQSDVSLTVSSGAPSIALSQYTKGGISSSGGDCAMWACDNTRGRFLFKNGNTWSVLPVEAPSFNATSDKRLKENIIPFTPEKSILDLPVYTFNFKSDKNKKKHVGCLAQDLQEICPDLVNEDSQGYLSIEESKITYLLLEEVKELKKQIEELKEKVNELEGK